jgi:hypothetical protein
MRKTVWVKTAIAAQELSVSVDYLLDLRETRQLTAGIHYRRVSKPTAKRPSYRWHLDNLGALFQEWSESHG